ncbi:hypothetical protein AVEN_88412-1 [Araneus ventricosus]|uniref:Uncharacterized protein n=1 Tax=Araneus ventricosus TaxID=182803 RepID=A0A4Y2GTI2_ARAVE|nr:hypothetical protein AVEN_88412-1 [Araneus ventricosus]
MRYYYYIGIINYLLLTSDPFLSFSKQMRKRKYCKPFSKKNPKMLLSGQVAISEDSEEEEFREVEDVISEEEDAISEDDNISEEEKFQE